MAQLYNLTSLRDTSSPPKKPSSLGSGLGKDQTDLSISPILKTAEGEVPNGSPVPETKKRVVVIGAGISGLRAASVLQRHGVDVVVVEGRDRKLSHSSPSDTYLCAGSMACSQSPVRDLAIISSSK
jgi:polyamine oxidase